MSPLFSNPGDHVLCYPVGLSHSTSATLQTSFWEEDSMKGQICILLEGSIISTHAESKHTPMLSEYRGIHHDFINGDETEGNQVSLLSSPTLLPPVLEVIRLRTIPLTLLQTRPLTYGSQW